MGSQLATTSLYALAMHFSGVRIYVGDPFRVSFSVGNNPGDDSRCILPNRDFRSNVRAC